MEDVGKYLEKYSTALIAYEKAVDNLETVVKEIDHVKGTEFFCTLRAQTGLRMVHNDIPRIFEKVMILREICERLKTSEPPTGIVLERGKNRSKA